MRVLFLLITSMVLTLSAQIYLDPHARRVEERAKLAQIALQPLSAIFKALHTAAPLAAQVTAEQQQAIARYLPEKVLWSVTASMHDQHLTPSKIHALLKKHASTARSVQSMVSLKRYQKHSAIFEPLHNALQPLYDYWPLFDKVLEEHALYAETAAAFFALQDRYKEECALIKKEDTYADLRSWSTQAIAVMAGNYVGQSYGLGRYGKQLAQDRVQLQKLLGKVRSSYTELAITLEQFDKQLEQLARALSFDKTYQQDIAALDAMTNPQTSKQN